LSLEYYIDPKKMLTLYDYLPSQNAWKVRLLLNHLEIPYNQKTVSIFEGDGHSEEYEAINPTGAVPAIQLDEGVAIAESNAILIYLATDTEYLPSTPVQKAQVLQWLFFESDYVQSSVATLRHWRLTGKVKNRTNEELSSKHGASIKVLTILDRVLGERCFLAGQQYTIADMSVYAYVHLAEEAGLSLKAFENIRHWIDLVQTQPRYLSVMYPYSIDPFSHREL